MPDSNELDDILKEIKNMNPDGDNKAPDEEFVPELKIEEAPVANEEKVLPDVDLFSAEKKQIKEEKKMPEKKNEKRNIRPIIYFAVAAVLILIIVVVAVCVTNKKPEAPVTSTEAPVVTEEVVTEAPLPMTNPLTGSSDFREKAVGKRPIACVVENAAAARPQWGINDSTNPPDIIVEGEVEGGETRFLFMYADYKAVPSQIGPMRSARPPYIKFSELFDAIFIHWGQSQTKKGTAYIGANTVFRVDKVDHINQMTYNGGVALFGRDSSRGVSTEHTGVLYGDKIAEAIKSEGFRTKAKQSKYTKFNFAEEEIKVSDTDCSSLSLKFSSRTNQRDWTFSDEDKMYHTSDFGTDVARKNLLVLFDTTEYIAKANYKNSGSAEIYCDYKLSGGDGKLATNGTVIDIKWSVENGLLVIKDTAGNDVNFNIGTTWIGYASSNNGGAVL